MLTHNSYKNIDFEKNYTFVNIIATNDNNLLTLTDKYATTKAAMSLSMWKLSATRAIELVI